MWLRNRLRPETDPDYSSYVTITDDFKSKNNNDMTQWVWTSEHGDTHDSTIAGPVRIEKSTTKTSLKFAVEPGHASSVTSASGGPMIVDYTYIFYL